MRMMGAQYLGALRNPLRSLEQCYDEEFTNKAPPTQLDFPYTLSCTCFNTSICDFKYQSQMDDSGLLFTAETNDSKEIYNSFVGHYSKEPILNRIVHCSLKVETYTYFKDSSLN